MKGSEIDFRVNNSFKAIEPEDDLEKLGLGDSSPVVVDLVDCHRFVSFFVHTPKASG